VETNPQLETDVWLDTTLTPELRQEGDARELIRVLQDLRKSSGLSQEDTVVIHLAASDIFKNTIETHKTLIQSVTRTQELIFVEDLPVEEIQVNEYKVKVVVQKV
jgi:isoleucyl-tRNA synthetase